MIPQLASPRRNTVVRALSLFFFSLSLWVAPASAQVDFVLRGEGGASTMLSTYQRDTLGFDHGISGSIRSGLRFADFFVLEIGVTGTWLPTSADRGTDNWGRLLLAGGGLRLEPWLGSVARLAFDGHANYAYTGGLDRFAIDAGIALEFQAGNDVGIGPFVRYTHVFTSGPNDGSDAMMISYGFSLSVGTARRDTPPDTDHDGYLDDMDVCITQPAGESPDPQRVGCPIVDADHDGVHDDRDVCPHDAEGAMPDPQRAGCPLVDTDRDGVADREDLCPEQASGPHADPARAGCPPADTDDDGVFDTNDICPTTAAGATPDPTRAGCPDGDDDGDAVLNAADQCRTEHAGFHPDAARAGCPMPDGDHDMIPDATDACPSEPGAPSSNARRNGCPGLVQLHVDSISIERPVYFATGSDRILPRSRAVLTALAEAMRLTPEIRRVSIEGHTDDVGDDDANMELSTRRAQSVMAWLVAHDIDASRLTARGFGETAPVAEGTSRAAREENRRVVFRVTDPASSASEGGAR